MICTYKQKDYRHIYEYKDYDKMDVSALELSVAPFSQYVYMCILMINQGFCMAETYLLCAIFVKCVYNLFGYLFHCLTQKNRKRKRKLSKIIMKRSLDERHTRKLNWNVSTITDVFLIQKRITLTWCTYIYSLLIKKNICDCWNILAKLLCVFVCLSSGDLLIFLVRVSYFIS